MPQLESRYADYDHADRLIRTAEYLVEQGLHRAASEVLMLVDRSEVHLLPVQNERLSDVALRIVAAIRGEVAHSLELRPRPLPLVWEDEETLVVC